MGTGETTAYGPITIGVEGWASPVLAEIDKMISACQTVLTSEDAPPNWPGRVPLTEYETACKQQEAVLAAGAELNARFLDRLREGGASGEFDGSLIAAINELMALFTPARWAYRDLRLPTRMVDSGPGVAMEVGEGKRAVPAELHFNTAELNLFTVALFLLCAGRVPKPLGLLILDDPLQNMDELTSTALARGLAKVLRVWQRLGRAEELLLLFHGYEDLTRFETELVGATYRLPWLSPGRDPQGIRIQADRTPPREVRVQDLSHLVTSRP
jgi:hypothetical protein